MEKANLLILNFDHSKGFSCTLKEILDSSSHFNTLFKEESMEIYGDPLYDDKLQSTITHYKPDVIFFVLSSNYLGQANALLQFMNEKISPLPIIVIIGSIKPDEMISLIKGGVADFITPPLKAIDIIPRIWRLINHKHQSMNLTQTLKVDLGLKQLIGESPVFLEEVEKIPILAKCDAGVLITGETGTGKELFARSIHYLSQRASHPFIAVNCGAIPSELIENEMFGHVRGAFTNAFSSHSGLIHEAGNGTLFLDEIDCLPFPVQVKLLRFLQDKVYRQLGSTKMHQANLRIIAASNLDLEKAVRDGKFRRDLFYRLNIIPIQLPPLRKRKEDIIILSRHFLKKYSSESNKQVKEFTHEALQKLLLYEWPGNVRELENIIERVIVFSKHNVIESSDIILSCSDSNVEVESFQTAKTKIIAEFEENYLKSLLLAHKGNITKAARTAQKNRRAFFELVRKHKIDVERLKSSHL